MSNEFPLISIVVLTYNQETTISRTLESILKQETEFSYEIILGEDASPSDNTRAVCERYVERYPDTIYLMPQSENKGIIKNYADCLDKCRGKYIAVCAGDDWWHDPKKIQKQVEFLEKNMDFGVVYGGAYWIEVATNLSFYIDPREPEEDFFNQLLLCNVVTAPTVCFRKNLLKHVNFDEFEELGFLMEDYPMWLIMSQYTKFHLLREPLVSYTINENSLSRYKDFSKQERFEANVLRVKLYYWAKYNSSLDLQLLLDSHWRTVFHSFTKCPGNRTLMLKLIRYVHNKTRKDKILLIVVSIPALYHIYCACSQYRIKSIKIKNKY